MFVALGPFRWGAGYTRDQALGEVRKRLRDNHDYKVYIYKLPEAAFNGVDGMGMISYTPKLLEGFDENDSKTWNLTEPEVVRIKRGREVKSAEDA